MPERIYIKDRSQAPKDAQVNQGARGGLYYEANSRVQSASDNSKYISDFVYNVDIEDSPIEHNISYINGKKIQTKGDKTSTTIRLIPEMFKTDFVNIHNHPVDSPPSIQDIALFLYTKQSKSVITTPSGKVYILERTKDTPFLTKPEDIKSNNIPEIQRQIQDTIFNLRVETLDNKNKLDYLEKKYKFKVLMEKLTTKKSLNFVQKADKKQLLELLDELIKSKDIAILGPKIKEFLTKYFGIYLSGLLMKEVMRERYDILGQRTLEDFDVNLIQNVTNNPLLWNSYSKVGEEVTNKINSILTQGIESNKLPVEIRKEIISQIKDITKSRAELIIRNETQNVRNIAREESYKQLDPNGERKYKWVGIDDSRTTEICRRISDRTKQGVSMDELKSIIREESDKKTFREDRPFNPHINCRRRVSMVIA